MCGDQASWQTLGEFSWKKEPLGLGFSHVHPERLSKGVLRKQPGKEKAGSGSLSLEVQHP